MKLSSLATKIKSLTALLLLAYCAPITFAEGFLSHLQPADDFPYRLESQREKALFVTGLSMTATSFVMDKLYERKSAEKYGTKNLSNENIFILDQLLMRPYSEFGHNAAHALFYITMLSPITMIIHQDLGTVFTIGMMYGETLLLSYGIKETVLQFFPRYRPLSYYNDTSFEQLCDQESRKSFPSGHTAHSFAAATFLTTVFSNMYPESPYRRTLAAASYGIASTVAVLRIAAGQHFFTDVLFGAACGTFIGWLVPHLHETDNKLNNMAIYPTINKDSVGMIFQLNLK